MTTGLLAETRKTVGAGRAEVGGLTLADGVTVNPVEVPEWVKCVGVDSSGNVFVEAKPKGYMNLVK